MKPFKEVERTRKQYHKDPGANSVHRASLLIPEIPGATAEISFLNHFLLKRNYPHVGLKITAIDHQGSLIESRLMPVKDPRVHTVRLTGMVETPAHAYMAEFFAAENLFIPFPAVMVNHHGPGFFNTVHSYNRNLNDVFENDAINAIPRAEASIDVRIERDIDTFVMFTAGPQGCFGQEKDSLSIELETPSRTFRATRRMETPRFCSETISLKELFPDLEPGTTGVLRVLQPSQFLFYGRMLVGTRNTKGQFSANHSYYDCSDFGEYWDDSQSSFRTYPFFQGFQNRVRMYPIVSPSELTITLDLRGTDGSSLGKVAAGGFVSPGRRFVNAEVGELARAAGIDPAGIVSFVVIADVRSGKMPARTNHQLIYASGDALESSINMSLNNPHVFMPPNKTGLTWGQIPVGRRLETRCGIVSNSPGGGEADVNVAIYSTDGLAREFRRTLPAGGAILLDSTRDLDFPGLDSEDPGYLWITATSSRPDLSVFATTRHRVTGHCTGDHGF